MKHISPEIRQKLPGVAAALLGILLAAAILLFDWDSINSYQAYNTSSTNYVRGRVVSVDSQTVEKDDTDPQLYLGSQELTVELMEGSHEGEQVTIKNYLTRVHSIYATEGQWLIICADTPESADPYYTVYGYDRSTPLMLLVLVFCAAVLLVGGTKGLRGLLGVGYSVFLVVLFMVQAIYHGFDPIWVSVLTVLAATGASLLLLNGFSRRTAAGILSTLAGVGIAGAVFAVFSGLLHLSGYNTDYAETLLMVSDSTGLSIRYLLLAGVLISALGAVMDVAVGLIASLDELLTVDPTLTRGALLRSGINIGRDMIGTMSNTLIMAFAGSALDTMLVLLAYGYDWNQLISSDFLTLEVSQGLCATLGVVLTVPVSSAISALIFIGRDRDSENSAARPRSTASDGRGRSHKNHSEKHSKQGKVSERKC